jgi:hypothetical protein
MPLNLNGEAMREQLERVATDPPAGGADLAVTDADGGTVRAEVHAGGSQWTASAWYQWAKDKGRGYGAKVGLKF